MQNLTTFASRDDVDDVPISTTVVGGAFANEGVGCDGAEGNNEGGDRGARLKQGNVFQNGPVESDSSAGDSDTE